MPYAGHTWLLVYLSHWHGVLFFKMKLKGPQVEQMGPAAPTHLNLPGPEGTISRGPGLGI